MMEQTILFLEIVKVNDHFTSCTFNVFFITCYFVSLSLKDCNHIHIVNPHTCIPAQTLFVPFLFIRLKFAHFFRSKLLELFVCHIKTKVEKSLVLSISINFQRNHTKHIVIYMIGKRNKILFFSVYHFGSTFSQTI